MYDEVMILVTGAVAGGAILPGFLLCVPGLLLIVVAPLLLLGLLIAVGLVVALVLVPVLVTRRAAIRVRRGLATRSVPEMATQA
jgi:hypothetical protein